MLSKYRGELDSKFRYNSKKILENYLVKSKRNSIIPNGTLVIMPSIGSLSLKILNEDTCDKGFSIPLQITEEGEALGLTPHYLLWFFRYKFVNEYLVSTLPPTVMPRVPKKVLYELLVPLPIYRNDSTRNSRPISDAFSNESFKDLIIDFYDDYRLNFDRGRYATAAMLGGAIAEAILYQLMIDSDVDLETIETDRSLTLGKLITYVKLLKLHEKLKHLPLTHFNNLQQIRSRVIHVGLAVKKKDRINKSDLICFDQIVKYFGL